MCDLVIEAGKKGKSKAGMCAAIDISLQTMNVWADEIPEFSEAIDKAMVYSQEYLEDLAQKHFTSQFFQSSTYNKRMGSQFRHKDGYSDQTANSGQVLNVISVEPMTAAEWEKKYKDDGDTTA